MFTQGEVAAVF